MSQNSHALGHSHAIEVLQRANETVPAVMRHVKESGVDPVAVGTPRGFATVPPTCKENFIRGNTADQLLPHAEITEAVVWSTSSGSSGQMTYWPRGKTSLYESIELYDRIFRTSFGSVERSTLAVIAFAMGTWVGGTYTLTALLRLRDHGHRLSLATPGIDIAAILDTLKNLGPYYEQVVLIGYPPFLKDVLDQAEPQVLGQDIKILMAGESITESWRDHVLDLIGKSGHPEETCLIYGTAEAGIMGNETATTIAIRRAALADRHLADELFANSLHDIAVQPTFVEYEPHFRYVETADGYLLFTTDTTTPLIRYRINDLGRVFSGAELEVLLRTHGYHDLAERVNTKRGYIALFGRPDVAETLYSANIYRENLHGAFEDPTVIDVLTGKFHLTAPLDEQLNPTLRLAVELRAGVEPGEDIACRITALALSALRRTNSEYRALYAERGDRVTPIVDLHPFGTAGFGRGPKNHYV